VGQTKSLKTAENCRDRTVFSGRHSKLSAWARSMCCVCGT